MVEMQQLEKLKLGDHEEGQSETREAAAACKFMSIISDDILQEILLRLPNSRTIFECGFVCKSWFSLISSLLRSHNFIQNFNHYHLHKRHLYMNSDHYHEQLPFSLLIRATYMASGSSSSTPDFLDFVPWTCPSLLASFDDLLLLQKSDSDNGHYCICNPLTKQWIELPMAPIHHNSLYRYGFVCKTKCNAQVSSYYCNCDINYRVVRINITSGVHTSLYNLAIFSSETGQWNESTFRFPELCLEVLHLVSFGLSNGTIYWPFGEQKLKGVFALDPYKEYGFDHDQDQDQPCRLISLPIGASTKARLGVVRGRLRLSHFIRSSSVKIFVLKVWELEDKTSSTKSWDLVHHFCLHMFDYTMLSLVALHPEDGDVVFFQHVGENKIWQYKIDSDNFESFLEFDFRDLNRDSLCVFPVVYPWWPTIIPAFHQFKA